MEKPSSIITAIHQSICRDTILATCDLSIQIPAANDKGQIGQNSCCSIKPAFDDDKEFRGKGYLQNGKRARKCKGKKAQRKKKLADSMETNGNNAANEGKSRENAMEHANIEVSDSDSSGIDILEKWMQGMREVLLEQAKLSQA